MIRLTQAGTLLVYRGFELLRSKVRPIQTWGPVFGALLIL